MALVLLLKQITLIHTGTTKNAIHGNPTANRTRNNANIDNNISTVARRAARRLPVSCQSAYWHAGRRETPEAPCVDDPALRVVALTE